jgi:uncharacterized repeat protein (TIGR03803 family)
MLGKSSFGTRIATLALPVLGVMLAGAWAQTETVLYSFCTQSKVDVCTDGRSPSAGVVFDQRGNLYGTTYFGGAYKTPCGDPRGCGAVFKLTPKGKVTVLHRFCVQNNCADGQYSAAGVVFDQKGNLYGTTFYGGANNSVCELHGYGCGVVFKHTPEGKETVLYSFCAQNNCTDGWGPLAGLVIDWKGNLYGTTEGGGAHGGGGVVFKLTPEGKETVLYSFCAQYKDAVCTDGASPNAGLIFDRKGNLYGTTVAGGAASSETCRGGCGVVFKLSSKGRQTILYRFCTQTSCTDGLRPNAGVVFDEMGNLYGTTVGGGAYQNGFCSDPGCGVVYKLTPQGKETVLYSFCAQTNCTDGEAPVAGVVFDQKGKLYGTTVGGGVYNDGDCLYGCGVVFKLTLKGKQTVLHSFCALSGCADGASPDAGLIFDQKGNLYGTTVGGGAYNAGLVFKLTP